VDRPQRSTVKLWLGLGLLVLSIHLLLLQTLPITLNSFTPVDSSMSFVVRAVKVPAAPRAEPAPKVKQVQARQRPPAPQPQAALADRSSALTSSMVDTMDDSLSPEKMAALAQAQPPEQAQDVQPATPTSEQTPSPEQMPTPEATAIPTVEETVTDPATDALAYEASAVPEPVKLSYQVHTNKFPFSLSGELVWYHSDARYQAKLEYGAFGQKRSQTSAGKLGHEGLLPDRFADKSRSELAAHFNRQQHKITFSANTPDAVLESGAQDRLSVLIQIATLMASAPSRFSPASTLTIQTVGPRAADAWVFTVGTSEALELPGGTLDAVKISRVPRQTYDQQLEIWLAPQLGYLPARVRITEANGDYVDQKWLQSQAIDQP
jgi:hypothetical protein